MRMYLPLILAVFATPALAEQHYNQISFSTQIEKTLPNDELQATLSKTAQAGDVKTLANTLNNTLNQATALAKKYPNVKVTTGSQHTYPRYNSTGKIIGHTGQATVDVTSQDFNEASEFIAKLQEYMTIDNLSFGVSDTTKKKHKKDIMSEAIADFQQEASFVSQNFGAKDYRLVKVELNHVDVFSNHARPMMAMNESVVSAKVTPQEFEAGESRINYQIAGVIELVK